MTYGMAGVVEGDGKSSDLSHSLRPSLDGNALTGTGAATALFSGILNPLRHVLGGALSAEGGLAVGFSEGGLGVEVFSDSVAGEMGAASVFFVGDSLASPLSLTVSTAVVLVLVGRLVGEEEEPLTGFSAAPLPCDDAFLDSVALADAPGISFFSTRGAGAVIGFDRGGDLAAFVCCCCCCCFAGFSGPEAAVGGGGGLVAAAVDDATSAPLAGGGGIGAFC